MAGLHRQQEKAIFATKIPKRDLQRLREFETKPSLTQDERFERDGIKLRLAKIPIGQGQLFNLIKIDTKKGILTVPKLARKTQKELDEETRKRVQILNKKFKVVSV